MCIFPRSLSARLFLIVLGGVVLAMAITNALHRHDRAGLIAYIQERNALEHLADAIDLLASLPPEARVSAAKSLPKQVWLTEFGTFAGGESGAAAAEFLRRLADHIENKAQVEGVWFVHDAKCGDGKWGCPLTTMTSIRFPDGQGLRISYTTNRRERPHRNDSLGFWGHVLVYLAIMAVAAWLVVRLALRPLQRMAKAAEDFGANIAHPPLAISGPTEVRLAAQAFNAMQERIRTYMAERTQILSAVTHDLKTPLTRMRLRLESCADEALKERLHGDIRTMQSLVEEGLELARSLETNENTQPVDLDALLQSLCDDAAEAGQEVVYDTVVDSAVLVAGRPNALLRIFSNIIDNAAKYGHYARVSLEHSRVSARVCVRDGGPGIPDALQQEVLKPFVRLEGSRCRDTGGTGLGLAIAVNLLRAQHGSLSLCNLAEGGLEVCVELPIASLRKAD